MLAKWLAVGRLDQQASCGYFLCNLDHLSTGKTPRLVGGVVLSKPWNSTGDIQGTYREVRCVKCDPGKLEFPRLVKLHPFNLRKNQGKLCPNGNS